MIEYIIIAIVQGLFEWLPISSSGQVLIISINFLGITPSEAYSLAIWLHLGTSLAVLLKFRRDYVSIVKSLFPKKYDDIEDSYTVKRNWLIIGTLGTAISGIPLYLIFKVILKNYYSAAQGDIITLIICGLLIITGIILLLKKNKFGIKNVKEMPPTLFEKDSFLAGLAQGFSVLPGISRSGITLSTILFENYNQEDALKLSFLISVPAVFGSIGVDIIFGQGSIFGSLNILIILIITLISFGVGYLSMEFLIKIASKVNFGYFCIIYGIISYIIIIPFLLIG
ncbi:MAG: Undecaprenyl-diphosphatase [Promethearchaeota archaeon]|nr:MAG: Undecaprenyl-diphosphatase [Candidatus Lokiarchaeota archaeon]